MMPSHYGMAADQPMRWLLLRGLTRESAHWGAFIPKLQAAFPDAEIHALDLPGTGKHYRLHSPDSIPAITHEVRQYAEDKGWLERPVHLLAISLGGMVAWDWLHTHAEDINAAVLINISLAGMNPFHERLRWQCYSSLPGLMMSTSLFQRELEIIKLVSNRPEVYEALAEEWAQIQQLRPVSLKNAFNQLLAAARYRPATNSPVQPVLLLNSMGDRLVSPRCTAALSKKWRLPYQTHPRAGHELCLDDGAWVISQIQTWLANLQRLTTQNNYSS